MKDAAASIGPWDHEWMEWNEGGPGSSTQTPIPEAEENTPFQSHHDGFDEHDVDPELDGEPCV